MVFLLVGETGSTLREEIDRVKISNFSTSFSGNLFTMKVFLFFFVIANAYIDTIHLKTYRLNGEERWFSFIDKII